MREGGGAQREGEEAGARRGRKEPGQKGLLSVVLRSLDFIPKPPGSHCRALMKGETSTTKWASETTKPQMRIVDLGRKKPPSRLNHTVSVPSGFPGALGREHPACSRGGECGLFSASPQGTGRRVLRCRDSQSALRCQKFVSSHHQAKWTFREPRPCLSYSFGSPGRGPPHPILSEAV